MHALLLEELVVGPLLHLSALPGLPILLVEALHAIQQTKAPEGSCAVILDGAFTTASSTSSAGQLLSQSRP